MLVRVQSRQKPTRRVHAVFCLALVSVSLPAAAQQPVDPAESHWSLGAALIFAPRPYVGADAEMLPIPLVQFESRRFYVRGVTVGYRLWNQERLTFDVHLQPRFDGFENGDSSFLAGMDEPDPTLDLGVGLELELGRFDLGLSLDADALGRSDGYEARISLARAWVRRGGNLVFRPELGVSWQSDDLVDYYYGVDPSEALPDRPIYRGGSGTLFDLGTLLRVRVAPRVSLIGLARWTSLPDVIRDSPIVDDDSTLFGLIGVTFDL